MKLARLFSIFPDVVAASAAGVEVNKVTSDSRQVGPGVVFVAVRGTTSDGHDYLEGAARAGAAGLVVEDESRVPHGFGGAVVRVTNSRIALERLAEVFFGAPAKRLFCAGVTGTNGKTTVTYMIERILNHHGWLTGVMGTIDHHVGERKWESQLTTPDPVTLQLRLSEFLAGGARAAAFEVSSHALDQARAASIEFAAAVFTNFTRDHLDYHGSMEAYFEAKEKLFTRGLADGGFAILNGDDPAIRRVRVRDGATIWWYGVNEADFQFKILHTDLEGSRFHLNTPRGEITMHLPCPGLHNVYNAVAALGVGLAAGVPLAAAVEALTTFYGAPGRLEKIPNARGLHVFVDYAHTDDAIRTVSRALRDTIEAAGGGGRLLTVFGCGGDRDRGKRPLMARAACEFADVVIVTSDNPRTEDPRKILEDIVAGVPEGWPGQRLVEIDRAKALAMALQTARKGDVILVAGKGHEDYQILGTTKHPFSDQKILAEHLKG